MFKKIICPICSRRLFDTDETQQIDMRPADQGISSPGRLYVKCSKCSSIWSVALEGRAKRNEFKQQSQTDTTVLSVPIENIPAGKINIQISYSVQS